MPGETRVASSGSQMWFLGFLTKQTPVTPAMYGPIHNGAIELEEVGNIQKD